MSRYIIALDAGTSKSKVILYSEKGESIYSASEPVKLYFPSPGLVEQDLNEIWDSTQLAIKKLVVESKVNPDEVVAIAVTAQADGVSRVGYDGNPAGNAINWMDGRAVDLFLEWDMDGTGDKVYETRGSDYYPGNETMLISWIMKNEPETVKDVKWFCSCKDWIKFKLTGDMTLDYSIGPTISKTKQLDDRMLAIMKAESIKDKFPPYKPVIENHAPLKPDMAEVLGLNAGIPVYCGPFDQTACALGLGNVHVGDCTCTLGTSIFVGVIQEDEDYEPFRVGYTLNLPTEKKKWNRTFSVMAGTPNLDWAIETFGDKYKAAAEKNGTGVYKEVDAAVARIAAGSGGIIYHPYLGPAGERSPFVKPTAKAQFFGLSSDHTTDHIMRAVFEGVAYSIRNCLDVGNRQPKTELRMAGGGAKSDVWCQIIADIVGYDVVLPEDPELGAKGAFLVAATGIGMYPTIEDAAEATVTLKTRFKPIPENKAVYDKWYELYKSLYKHVWDDWDYRMGVLLGMI